LAHGKEMRPKPSNIILDDVRADLANNGSKSIPND
jgi:hypothetical protein